MNLYPRTSNLFIQNICRLRYYDKRVYFLLLIKYIFFYMCIATTHAFDTKQSHMYIVQVHIHIDEVRSMHFKFKSIVSKR